VKWLSDKAEQLNDYTESKIKETEKGASFLKKLSPMELRAVNYVVKSIVTDGEFSIGNVGNRAYQDIKNSVLSNTYRAKVLTNNIDPKNLIQLTDLSHKVDISVQKEELEQAKSDIKRLSLSSGERNSDAGNIPPQDLTRLQNIHDKALSSNETGSRNKETQELNGYKSGNKSGNTVPDIKLNKGIGR
jgi:hypothetical protein